MKVQATKPTLIVKKGESLSISGPALLDLLRAVLDKGRPFRFRARGFSMSPFVRNEDLITVSPMLKRVPRLGEVVAYVCAETGKLIVHRVVGKKDNCYLIVGDNTPGKYDLAPEANVLGRITSVKRKGRNVFLGLGPERILIAFLSRRRWLFPLIAPVRKLRQIRGQRSEVRDQKADSRYEKAKIRVNGLTSDLCSLNYGAGNVRKRRTS